MAIRSRRLLPAIALVAAIASTAPWLWQSAPLTQNTTGAERPHAAPLAIADDPPAAPAPRLPVDARSQAGHPSHAAATDHERFASRLRETLADRDVSLGRAHFLALRSPQAFITRLGELRAFTPEPALSIAQIERTQPHRAPSPYTLREAAPQELPGEQGAGGQREAAHFVLELPDHAYTPVLVVRWIDLNEGRVARIEIIETDGLGGPQAFVSAPGAGAPESLYHVEVRDGARETLPRLAGLAVSVGEHFRVDVVAGQARPSH
ncbi:hypothetical protein J2T57_001462 [Natronocella acetinitrilica]|uniref:Uncharacterized protein n=1 Tax=Natronocella acetinitrilica TaxID=414046 RepID=A0AAE3KAI4_9GAMM|nr:hypothetical protein [Natronocella acetinitrilica]MCP1674360.1 hypothetical protein [Natronocella acetinitrilica]